MRFVKTGYDNSDPTVPPNAVVFDSNDISNMAIVDRGSAHFTGPGGFSSGNIGSTSSFYTLRSWSFDFIPLCLFTFSGDAVNVGNACLMLPLSPVNAGGIDRSAIQFKVDTAGIHVKLSFSGTSLYIGWVAFNLHAGA